MALKVWGMLWKTSWCCRWWWENRKNSEEKYRKWVLVTQISAEGQASWNVQARGIQGVIQGETESLERERDLSGKRHMSTSGWGYCKRRHRRGPLLALMGECWGAGFTKKDMDGLASWVGGDPEEGMVMKPAGGGQCKVDYVEENESRTVLRRRNREQLPTPQ